MQSTKKQDAGNKNRLISVIILLMIVFGIWFGTLLNKAQQDLKIISEKMRSDIIIRKKGAGDINGGITGSMQSGNVQSGGVVSSGTTTETK